MYETDQEQIEAIKSWWSRNGNLVIGAFILFIAAYVGFHWYQGAEQSHRYEGSDLYEQLLVQATAEDSDAAKRAELSTQLKDEYADLGYGTMAALIEAKIAVEAEDFDAALTELSWAEENAKPELLPVILYRKAQVEYALGNLDAALATLASIDGDGHQALTFELKGDVLLEQGKADEARAAYQAALAQAETQGINNPYLKIKVDDLAVAE